MLGCPKCQNPNSPACEDEYEIRIYSLRLVCPTCRHEIDIIEGLSFKCPFYQTRGHALRRNWLPYDEVERRINEVLRDMKGEGPQGSDWGVSYKRLGGAPQFTLQPGAVQRMETVKQKLPFIVPMTEEDIDRYRELPVKDSCGDKQYVSLEQTAATESKFNSFESYNTAHGGYEAQALSDRMLKQNSAMNTLSRRKSLNEQDLVLTGLHRARAHNEMLMQMGFGRKIHPWLSSLADVEDTGERFLFDYLKQLKALATFPTPPGEELKTTILRLKDVHAPPSTLIETSIDSSNGGAVPTGPQLGGTEALRDRALLCIDFVRPTEPSPAMAHAATREQRSQLSASLSKASKSVFAQLCQKAGVNFHDQVIPHIGKTLQEVFNMAVPVDRLEPDRGLKLCVLDGPCYQQFWKGSYRADGVTKRQPRRHDLACPYKALALIQEWIEKNPTWRANT